MRQLRILWLNSAKSELRKIKLYYKEVAGIQVAEQVFQSIKITPNILMTHPDAGQIEELLKPLKEGHRYLVTNNYKIIYKKAGDTIFITDVFDTRQNPKKLIKRIKSSN